MSDSIHDKIRRVRKPRVHITYEVDTGGAVEEKELPFVMGVMGDYSGDNVEGKKPLKERKFSAIDRDNFNEVMGKVGPKLDLKVANVIDDDDSEIAVSLEFNSMEDFEPQKIVEQVASLKHLMETRSRLRDLLTKADRSDKLENLLEEVLCNTDALTSLQKELGNDDEGEEKGE